MAIKSQADKENNEIRSFNERRTYM